jgi:glycosyltransferase involved in cell wall biosynthesis
MNDSPAVSIGLPVYNGERYLGVALDSLLSQDYADFELIISDNASVDRTAGICREYAAQDRRIRYFRNEYNIGINPNFNRPLQLARAPLFRWAAHDDLVDREFLGACVELLRAAPDAVLAQSHVRIIDTDGRDLGTYDGGLAGTESADLAERFAALILSGTCARTFQGDSHRRLAPHPWRRQLLRIRPRRAGGPGAAGPLRARAAPALHESRASGPQLALQRSLPRAGRHVCAVHPAYLGAVP